MCSIQSVVVEECGFSDDSTICTILRELLLYNSVERYGYSDVCLYCMHSVNTRCGIITRDPAPNGKTLLLFCFFQHKMYRIFVSCQNLRCFT